MAKFNAATAVEPLNYDFRPYAEVTGTVPEPSDDQVAEFYTDLAKQLERALGEERVAGVDMTEPTAVGRLFLELSADDHRKMYDTATELHAAVCGGSPSADELKLLPHRLRLAFYGMLQEWLRPEASKPATSK